MLLTGASWKLGEVRHAFQNQEDKEQATRMRAVFVDITVSGHGVSSKVSYQAKAYLPAAKRCQATWFAVAER